MTELTFTKRVVIQQEKTEYVKVTLKDYVKKGHWGMFSSKGNKSITDKALVLINKLEKAKTTTQKVNALTAFLRSYRRMGSTKTMGETSDTEVRECIWDFFEKACNAIGFGSNTADELWESPESGY